MNLEQLLARKRRERELLAERRSEACSCAQKERANRPEEPAAFAERMRAAWASGVFENRKIGYSKRTDAKVDTARRMRAAGCTYSEIAMELGVTLYTVAKWLGWQRKSEPTNRTPIAVDGIQYPSLRSAARATGIPRHRLQRLRHG